MKGFPPPILVDTWLHLATNNNPDLAHIKLPIRRALKKKFGSIELARIYVEESKDKENDVYYV